MDPSTSRRIEENPALPDGLYDALIRDIRLRRSSRDTQISLLFYLPDQQMHLVCGLRAPKRSFNGQDLRRLMEFCSAINVDIPHLFNTPAKVKGRQLRVKTERSYCDSDGTTHWYSDIESFTSFGNDAERNTELGMNMVPHSGVQA